ncbi:MULTISPECIES: Uma2 family endonuclease [unclassified Pedobacter]|uniref:Uma2 family endonuclease n=1 Tax=unclassified Pedobacter TaxID=2628915 RepID=UPI00141F6ECB|nr:MULTISPECIES: Uma2 family endonuclease [unclassified Pedobacter]NII83595.1 Uma2 family endonuclease [Pedobacter sp. SG908]NMN37457.1 Uma2 family endonuclease [Pedobacter sp. SG918]
MKNIKPYPTEEELPPIKTLNEVDFSAIYSYADYMRFEFEERLEIIKGHLFKMSPVPSRIHQGISANIFAPIYNILKGKPCRVYSAPFDVRLAKKSVNDKEVFTVVQPDIVVVCDPAKLDNRGCIGAPDIVIEILSPGNNKKELINKYEVYEEAGVKEYWIISPSHKTFFRYILDDNGKFQPTKLLTEGEEVTTAIMLGFKLVLDEVFQD